MSVSPPASHKPHGRPMPWRDRKGAFSWLKALVFAALFLPAAFALWNLSADPPLARPVMETLRLFGRWAVWFLLASLAVTPLRAALGWPRLILVRRMLGVAAFGWIALHFGLYIVDQRFALGTVAREIALRIYLAIGFSAFLMLAALAATSTDGMIRRLGSARWQRLHRLAYVAAALGLVHHFLQSKSDLWLPTFAAGVAFWLLLWRLAKWSGRVDPAAPATLLALALVAALGVGWAETLYLALKFDAPFLYVAEVQFEPIEGETRPAFWLLAAGLALAAAAAIRRRFGVSQPR